MDSSRKSLNERIIDQLKSMNAFDIDTNLNVDMNQLPDQKYAAVAYCGPDQRAKHDKNCMNILGIFENQNDINDFLNNRSSKLKQYDIYTVELYAWIGSYPVKNETQAERDKFLNKIIANYKKEHVTNRIKYDARRLALRSNENKTVAAPASEMSVKDVNELFVQTPPVASDRASILNMKPLEPTDLAAVSKTPIGQMDKSNDKYNFAILCIVGITGSNKRTAVKIKGAFDTMESAKARAEQLSKDDPLFDYIICEMYNWLETDKNLDSVERIYDNKTVAEYLQKPADKHIKQVHTDHKELHDYKAAMNGETNEKPLIDEIDFMKY
jgi:hypothetical protein